MPAALQAYLDVIDSFNSQKPWKVYPGSPFIIQKFLRAHPAREFNTDTGLLQVDVLAVEMEGAAVAQVCHDYGLPFAAVRTISDRADDAAHGDFAQYVQTVASRYAEHMVFSFLQKL